MSKVLYSVMPLSLTGKPCFAEATREELRVLLALIERGGEVATEEELARLSDTSKSRCISSLAFWEEGGVISKISHTPTLSEEFEEKIRDGGIDEEDSVEVAKSIRDESLAVMLDECASLMQKTALSTNDIKNISALYTQYALSEEFIVTLAAHLSGKGKLTSVILKNKAIKLVESGCDTLEELEAYIESKEKETGAEWEFRRALGIYNRTLSKSERDYFRKWSEDFGYSVDIVSEAYDVAVLNTGKFSLQYMDSILTSWHDAGCKTVAECRAKRESEKNEQKAKRPVARKTSRTEEEKPRYGSFDINEAFRNALLRSYGEDGDK